MSDVTTISAKRLAELDAQGNVDLIDVRAPTEFCEVHAAIARNVPLDSLDPHAVMKERNGTAGEPLYVICRTGNRAHKACQKFHQAGYTNVVNVEGGTEAWEAAGLPVVRGKKTISLERQVRIAAGFLVLFGSLLAIFMHPWWAVLPAFVGAGLIFAGVTDTCGMAMLLARMPWNQVKEKNAPACCSK